MIAALALTVATLTPGQLVEPPPLAEIAVAADATSQAERLDEPAPPPATPTPTTESAGGRCTGAEPLLADLSPGWDVTRMSRIAWRESRCIFDARNRTSTATGLLQVLASHCPWLARRLGEPCSRDRLTDPVYNVRAAAALWLEQGYGAWVTA